MTREHGSKEARHPAPLGIHAADSPINIVRESCNRVFQVFHAIANPRYGVANLLGGVFSYDGIADNANNAFVRGELLPTNVTETSSDYCALVAVPTPFNVC